MATATRSQRATKHDVVVNNDVMETPSHSDDDDVTFGASGVITLTRSNGAKAYIRQTSFQHFLNSIKEGEVFTYKHIPLTPSAPVWGAAEFRVVLAFLRLCKLVEKVPGGYVVRSVRALKDAWNKSMDATKL